MIIRVTELQEQRQAIFFCKSRLCTELRIDSCVYRQGQEGSWEVDPMTCQNPRRLEGSLLWRLSRLTARKSLSPSLKGNSVSPLQGKRQPQCSRACCSPALPPCHWVPCVGTAEQPSGVSLVGPLTLWHFRLLSLLLLPYGLHTLRLSGRPVLESFPSPAFPLSWQRPVSSPPRLLLAWSGHGHHAVSITLALS